MASHVPHPDPEDRDEFLVDGCPRCAEYERDLGLHFTPDRFRAFWRKMLEVEYDVGGGRHSGYASELDHQLGRKLYYVSLVLQRAYGIDPRALAKVGH